MNHNVNVLDVYMHPKIITGLKYLPSLLPLRYENHIQWNKFFIKVTTSSTYDC